MQNFWSRSRELGITSKSTEFVFRKSLSRWGSSLEKGRNSTLSRYLATSLFSPGISARQGALPMHQKFITITFAFNFSESILFPAKVVAEKLDDAAIYCHSLPFTQILRNQEFMRLLTLTCNASAIWNSLSSEGCLMLFAYRFNVLNSISSWPANQDWVSPFCSRTSLIRFNFFAFWRLATAEK